MNGKLESKKHRAPRAIVNCWFVAVIVLLFSISSVEAQAPIISNFSPRQGLPGAHVEVSGTSLEKVVAFQFNGIDAIFFSGLAPGSIFAVVPWEAATGPLTVRSPEGSYTTLQVFEVTARPAPIVDRVSPNRGAPGETVFLYGSYLVDVSSVKFNGIETPFMEEAIFPPGGSYIVQVPTNATTGPITITARTGSFTTPDAFVVVEPPFLPPPVITSFTPASGPPGTGVVLMGSNLLDVVSIQFNGVASPSTAPGITGEFYSAGVPTNATTGPVTITTRSGSYTSSNSFTVLGYPAPTLGSFYPESAEIGSEITLNGVGLLRATEVRINGVPARFFPAYAGSISIGAQMIAIVPTNAITGPITVVTPEGTAVSSKSLTVLAEPRVFGFDIASGPPGTVVEILGAGLGQVASVALGETSASFTQGPAGLKFTVPAGARSGPVTVATVGRTLTSSSIFFVQALADPLEHWAGRGRLSGSISGIAYGNGLFVALGSPYDRTGIITSPDGVGWTARATPILGDWLGVAFGEDQFVVVGYGRKILTSTDGISWTRRDCGIDSILTKVAHGEGGFVVLCERGMILRSKDGITWEKGVSGTTQELSAIAAGNGVFVAGGNSTMLIVSDDGLTWRRATVDQPFAFLSDITFGNGLFVGVGNGFTMTSTNGAQWTRQTLKEDCFVFLRTIGYGGRNFTAISDYQGTIATSTNGIEWRCGKMPTIQRINGVAYGQDRFIAVGQQAALLSSTDGETWRREPAGNPSLLVDVAFGNDVFVAVGDRFPGRSVLTSSSGVNWSESGPINPPAMEEQPISAVIFDGAKFVAVGGAGGASVQQSENGSNWLGHAASPANASVAYANGVYVSVGSDPPAIGVSPVQSQAAIALSLDGWDWTRLKSPASPALRSVTHGNNCWIAVGDQGTILRSTNTVQWDPVASGTTKGLCRVLQGDNKFVAVGETILVSSDGVAWSAAQTEGFYMLRGLAYGKAGFVAVGGAGTILTSLDGLAWKTRNSGTFQDLYGVVYGAETYVIVGANGIVLQSGPANFALKFGSVRASPAALEVGLMGESAQSFIIEASTNLIDWIQIPIVRHPQQAVFSLETDTRKLPKRFYRAMLVY